MAPCLKGVNHNSKFKVMGWIILLMFVELSRGVGYNLSLLHKDTSEPKLGSVAIYDKVLGHIGIVKTGAVASLFFNSWKLLSHFSVHSNFLSLSNS